MGVGARFSVIFVGMLLVTTLVLGGCAPGIPKTAVEMTIDRVTVSSLDYSPTVVLKEKGGQRYLPIAIGIAEAEAIAAEMYGVIPQRPRTHDLLRSVGAAAGGDLEYILIDDLREDTFYAKIALADGRATMVDSRPSDALALALRAKVPIYVEASVLEKAAISAPQYNSDHTW